VCNRAVKEESAFTDIYLASVPFYKTWQICINKKDKTNYTNVESDQRTDLLITGRKRRPLLAHS
ncbi:hypothetical protein ACF5FN_004605, partial [Enterobacter chengduensis]